MEKWKSVVGYEGFYEVSDKGNVRSVERVSMNKTKNGGERPCLIKGRDIKKHIRPFYKNNSKGSITVNLSAYGKTKTMMVHRMVAEAFLGEIKGFEINHKDGDRHNNILENLEICTRLENIRHAFENNLINTKKPVCSLNEDGSVKDEYESEAEACRQLGINQGRVSKSIREGYKCQGLRWRFL